MPHKRRSVDPWAKLSQDLQDATVRVARLAIILIQWIVIAVLIEGTLQCVKLLFGEEIYHVLHWASMPADLLILLALIYSHHWESALQIWRDHQHEEEDDEDESQASE